MKRILNAAMLLAMMCMALPLVAQNNLPGRWFGQLTDPAGDVPMVFNITLDLNAGKAMSIEIELKIDAQIDKDDNTTRMVCEMLSTGSGTWSAVDNCLKACADNSSINTNLTKLDFPLMDPTMAAMVKDPIKAEFNKQLPAAIRELMDAFCSYGLTIVSNDGNKLVLASGDDQIVFTRRQ